MMPSATNLVQTVQRLQMSRSVLIARLASWLTHYHPESVPKTYCGYYRPTMERSQRQKRNENLTATTQLNVLHFPTRNARLKCSSIRYLKSRDQCIGSQDKRIRCCTLTRLNSGPTTSRFLPRARPWLDRCTLCPESIASTTRRIWVRSRAGLAGACGTAHSLDEAVMSTI